MRSRLVVLTVLILALVGLMTLDGSPPPRAVPTTSLVPKGAVVPGGGASSSIWFCAAASAGTSTAPVHEVIVSNPTEDEVDATVTEVVAAPDPAATDASSAPPPATTAVPGRSSLVVGVATAGASVQVELSAAGPVVSHRLVSNSLFDEAPCATSGSATWYLPAVNTNSAEPEGANAQLWLFNPFPSDASVDISVVSDEGVRRPGAMTGIVVAGGSNRLVDVGAVVKLRSQVALDIRTRAGLVVAELSQVNGAPPGLRLTPGAPSTETRLAFADGVVGAGLAERYVIFNPSRRSASVLLQVVPYDADPALLPEPFDLDVPARRFVVLDIDQQARVPQDRPHWVRLESVNGVGVAVERSLRLTAESELLGLDSGFAATSGASVAATRFVTPWADRSGEAPSFLAVANPAVDTIAEVEVRAYGAGGLASGDDVQRVELGAGRGTTVQLGATGGDPRGVLVTSSSPVIVERRVHGSSGDDLAVVAGVPRSGDLAPLPSMSEAVAAGTGS